MCVSLYEIFLYTFFNKICLIINLSIPVILYFLRDKLFRIYSLLNQVDIYRYEMIMQVTLREIQSWKEIWVVYARNSKRHRWGFHSEDGNPLVFSIAIWKPWKNDNASRATRRKLVKTYNSQTIKSKEHFLSRGVYILYIQYIL